MDRYLEFAPPTGLASVVACLWEHHGMRDREQRVIPDGFARTVLQRKGHRDGLVAAAARRLGQRAAVAGYASQAHMSDDLRRLTGLTPVRFLEDAALTTA